MDSIPESQLIVLHPLLGSLYQGLASEVSE